VQTVNFAIKEFHQTMTGDKGAFASEAELAEEMVRRARQQQGARMAERALTFFSSEITQLKRM
jgi:hypothetical protein